MVVTLGEVLGPRPGLCRPEYPHESAGAAYLCDQADRGQGARAHLAARSPSTDLLPDPGVKLAPQRDFVSEVVDSVNKALVPGYGKPAKRGRTISGRSHGED